MLPSSRFLLTLGVLACGVATSLRAQGAIAGATGLRPVSTSRDTVEATEGSRVRLGARTIQNPTLTGTLIAVRGDSLWLRYGLSPTPIALTRDALTRLEVSGGHPGQGRRALVGALVGATAGALFGAVVSAGGGCQDCTGSDTGLRFAIAGFFGGIGGFGGMLVGAMTSGPERWYPGRLASAVR